MACYLISRASESTLETVVFAMDPSGSDEAVAVFSDPATARLYIEKSGMSDEYTVATLEPIPFLRWLLHVHEDGIEYLLCDPDFEAQKRGQPQNTLDVRAHLEHAGNHIMQVVHPDF